jgi:N-ethylmaleimide reductase
MNRQKLKENSEQKLFEAFQLGPFHFQNRIAMAPLTRKRATKDHVPVPIMAEYYRQRATAGLIISEASNISHEGVGYTFTPGIWHENQIEAWKPVTEAVHEAGGHIFCQLWHCGRHSHSSMQPNGKLPLAPSAIPDGGRVGTFRGYQPAEVPRAMERADIERTVADYAHAAVNARKAGFDGVEIHAANGYLIHQFLMQSSNVREDEYGGSFENRSRFLFQVLEAVVSAWDGDHTGIRLSPSYYKYGMSDPQTIELFGSVISRLNNYKILYLHLTEPYFPIPEEFTPLLVEVAPHFRNIFKGTLLSCGNHTRESALQYMEEDIADMIVFGKAFISNPGLVNKLRDGIPLTPWDVSTFYAGGEKGYIDYS